MSPLIEPATSAPSTSAPQSPAAYTARNLRDPMQSQLPKPKTVTPVSTASAGDSAPALPPVPPPLTVQGLVWGGPTPQAIINGAVYGINDVIEGAKIVAIDRRGVTFEYAGVLLAYAPSLDPSKTERASPHPTQTAATRHVTSGR